MTKHERTLSWLVGCSWLLGGMLCVGAASDGPSGGKHAAPPPIEARGIVGSRREFVVRLRPGERVLSAVVASGDLVEEGALLAELFDGDARLRLDGLEKGRLDRQLAAFELESKTSRLARIERELEAQLALWREVDEESAERRTAALRERRDDIAEQLGLLRLRCVAAADDPGGGRVLSPDVDAQIRGLRRHLAAARLEAPFSGRVAHMAEHPTRLGAGEILIEVWDTNLVVRVDLLQHQLGRLRKGGRAEVTLEFSDDPTSDAVIESFDPKAESRAGDSYPSYSVTLGLVGRPVHLVPGMRVLVRLVPGVGEGPPLLR